MHGTRNQILSDFDLTRISPARYRQPSRQLAVILSQAAKRTASRSVMSLMQTMAEAIVADDRMHFAPACTCFRGLVRTRDENCPACAFYGPIVRASRPITEAAK